MGTSPFRTLKTVPIVRSTKKVSTNGCSCLANTSAKCILTNLKKNDKMQTAIV